MTAPDLFEVCEATWPPAGRSTREGWIIRDGAGGGQRVSATTAATLGAVPDIAVAEAGMTALGQPHLFQIRPGEGALDAALEARGYVIRDPVSLYLCRVDTLARHAPKRMAAFHLYPPLAIMQDIWAEGGIGPARLAVMDRAMGPKTAIFARTNDLPAGVAFVGIHENCAMLHALEVPKTLRRQGSAINIMGKAAVWAQDMDARWMAVLVTQQNDAANRLYTSLGMDVVGHYHYRIKVP